MRIGTSRAEPGEDLNFPTDQIYNLPEDKLISVKRVSETADDIWKTTARDLTDVHLDRWWLSPNSLYTRANHGGGPFIIGRLNHSSRSVGFTGWIGGVVVFNQALSAEQMAKLMALAKG